MYVVVSYPSGRRSSWPDLETDYPLETLDQAQEIASCAREQAAEHGSGYTYAVAELTLIEAAS